jgi:hypothetical protein
MNEDVLREFLVSLGFAVDEAGFKKFNLAVESVTKGVMQAGVAVAATAAGIVAGVKIISSQMENLYYASQRTGATVGNLMALRYAAGQIGLTADQAQSSLEGFTRTLRLNPGSNSLLSSLGVTGNDPTEKFDSFIEKMRGMQPYVAAAYAGLFGIDPDTLLMLENGLPKLEDEQRKYQDRLSRFGINPDQAAESGKDFNNAIRSVKEDFEDLWIVIESKLTPVMTPLIDQFERWAQNHAGDVAQAIADAVSHLATWIQSVDWKKVGSDIDHVVTALGGVKGILIELAAIKLLGIIGGIGGLTVAISGLAAAAAGLAGWKIGDTIRDEVDGLVTKISHGKYRSLSDILTGTDRSKLDATGGYTQEELDSVKDGGGAKLTPSRGSPTDDGNQPFGTIIELPPGNAPSRNDPQSLFGSLEDRFNLPKGLLDSDWSAESSRGKNMLSPKGAMGHFGFMPDTAKEYGLDDPDDLVQSAKAAARKFADLLRHYAGDAMKAIAGYNWGEGNLDRDISRFGGNWAQHLPQETFDYVNRVTNGMGGARLGVNGTNSNRSVSVNQNNTFHIAGTSDPQGTARAVASEQYRLYGDMVRNFSGAVQ